MLVVSAPAIPLLQVDTVVGRRRPAGQVEAASAMLSNDIVELVRSQECSGWRVLRYDFVPHRLICASVERKLDIPDAATYRPSSTALGVQSVNGEPGISIQAQGVGCCKGFDQRWI